jgi:hypothetical protein
MVHNTIEQSSRTVCHPIHGLSYASPNKQCDIPQNLRQILAYSDVVPPQPGRSTQNPPPACCTDHASHDEALNTTKSRNFPKATWRATSSYISHIPRLLNGNSTTTSRLPGPSQITARPVHTNGFAVTVIPTAAATMDAQDKLALSRSSRSMTRRYNAFLYRASYRGDKGSAGLETLMP